jgi:hypothetical protein
MDALLVIIGFIILTAGHQVNWMFVGSVGFVIGSFMVRQYRVVHTELESIIFSLTSGLLGSMLVVYLRKWIVILASMICGVYICYYLPVALGWNTAWISWPYLLLAALSSGLLVLVWGALPLILISTLMGTTLIIRHIHLTSVTPLTLFTVLLLFGLITQWLLWQYSVPVEE